MGFVFDSHRLGVRDRVEGRGYCLGFRICFHFSVYGIGFGVWSLLSFHRVQGLLSLGIISFRVQVLLSLRLQG